MRNFSGDSLQCWCITQGYTEVLRDRNLRDICADWLQEDGKNSAIAVLTAVVVVPDLESCPASVVTCQCCAQGARDDPSVITTSEGAHGYARSKGDLTIPTIRLSRCIVHLAKVSINVILQVFTKEMAEWQRPISESGLNASIVYRLFVAQYINTAVVTSLISADVWPFEGPYSDFERGWYSIVGVPIITALMFNVVSGSASTLGKWAFICFKRTFCWRRPRAAHFSVPLSLHVSLFRSLWFSLSLSLSHAVPLPCVRPRAFVYVRTDSPPLSLCLCLFL